MSQCFTEANYWGYFISRYLSWWERNPPRGHLSTPVWYGFYQLWHVQPWKFMCSWEVWRYPLFLLTRIEKERGMWRDVCMARQEEWHFRPKLGIFPGECSPNGVLYCQHLLTLVSFLKERIRWNLSGVIRLQTGTRQEQTNLDINPKKGTKAQKIRHSNSPKMIHTHNCVQCLNSCWFYQSASWLVFPQLFWLVVSPFPIFCLTSQGLPVNLPYFFVELVSVKKSGRSRGVPRFLRRLSQEFMSYL